MSRALGARVARLAERLGRAGGFRWPAGPVGSWPGGEQDRLVRLMAAGGGLDWAATERLTDADLDWLIASGCGDAGAERAAAAGGVGPGRCTASPSVWPRLGCRAPRCGSSASASASCRC